MGFEIDNEYIDENIEEMVATSNRKIGTMTFIKKDTKEFVALGHPTKENKSKEELNKGFCYGIEYEGINKASKDNIGNIVAYLNVDDFKGYIYENNEYGLFGKVEEINADYEEVETGCWYEVRKGKANLLCAIGEEDLKSYDVEIINIDYINKNKNIKIKINDEELIEKAGGVVQGMSGTPLMQNRKAYPAL